MAHTPIHPGEILAYEVTELGVAPTELSRQLAGQVNRITRIIQGGRTITGATALRLGHWFRTSAQFGLNVQTAYDLDRAAAQVGREVESLPTRPDMAEKPAQSAPV